MLALSDNDIICKLVACNVFDEALALYSCTRMDVRVLRESKWTIGNRARPNSKHRKSVIAAHGEATAKAIGDLLETLMEIRAPSPATDHLLVDAAIDPGERHLLRVAYEDHETLVATSDKKALLRVIDDAECQPIRSAIAGRVVIFETVLLGLIARHGYAWVAERAAPARAGDGTLRLAFSGGSGTSERHAVDCLRSFATPVAAVLRPL